MEEGFSLTMRNMKRVYKHKKGVEVGSASSRPSPVVLPFPKVLLKNLFEDAYLNVVVFCRVSFAFGLLSVSFGPSLVSVLVRLPRTAACTHLRFYNNLDPSIL